MYQIKCNKEKGKPVYTISTCLLQGDDYTGESIVIYVYFVVSVRKTIKITYQCLSLVRGLGIEIVKMTT